MSGRGRAPMRWRICTVLATARGGTTYWRGRRRVSSVRTGMGCSFGRSIRPSATPTSWSHSCSLLFIKPPSGKTRQPTCADHSIEIIEASVRFAERYGKQFSRYGQCDTCGEFLLVFATDGHPYFLTQADGPTLRRRSWPAQADQQAGFYWHARRAASTAHCD